MVHRRSVGITRLKITDIMLQTTETPDATLPTPSEELANLKSMSFDELISKLTGDIIHFFISLAIAIAIFYLGKFIINKIYSLINKLLQKRKVEASLTTFILSFVQIVLYFILIVTVIGILGIPTSSFLALFASAGVAIGMALSGTLQNFAGGVLILLLKPFKVGDTIEAQGFTGTVKKIEIFNTYLNTPDNKSIIIPNGGLSTGSINNYSKEDYRRVDWTVSIAYGNDFAKAQEVLGEMLNELSHPIVREIDGADKSPVIRLASLSASSVDITVRAWVRAVDYWEVFFGYNELVYAQLEKRAGVSFPFPQMDVHLVK